MGLGNGATQSPRTVLEQRIRERRQTFEEFVEFAETFAREHHEPGTLSVRHLQRLTAGRRPDGSPLGSVRPATARLLERIFSTSIGELLSAPHGIGVADESAEELRRMLGASERVDADVIALLNEQLDAVRRLDRQLGAIVAHDEVKSKAEQVARLLAHSLLPGVRSKLAGLLSELHTLAGWQALDIGSATKSWQHYEHAKAAAVESGAVPFEAHSAAEQAFVLLEIGKSSEAVEILADARSRADRSASRLLRAWIAAAHGEALAVAKQRSASLRAFDEAAALLPADTTGDGGPYVALDPTHLARWRGHALARFGDAEAVSMLSGALERLDPSFARAEAALRVDLATALLAMGEQDAARQHAAVAGQLAAGIGSARQDRRLRTLARQLV
ncbi:hypothetical protein KALB_1750 [Kutzneria albida DSM 43870]|uniref:Uncharacterized protein n=1 Tax=Kutzneria albida DSM 43870 TaxID=1449976 RepID=W5W3V7_9PSEU|nr:hypothetical protein KALB_1750 [Kutzneria albida DSM 43870]